MPNLTSISFQELEGSWWPKSRWTLHTLYCQWHYIQLTKKQLKNPSTQRRVWNWVVFVQPFISASNRSSYKGISQKVALFLASSSRKSPPKTRHGVRSCSPHKSHFPQSFFFRAMGLLGNPHEDPGTAETWGIVTWFFQGMERSRSSSVPWDGDVENNSRGQQTWGKKPQFWGCLAWEKKSIYTCIDSILQSLGISFIWRGWKIYIPT